MNWIKKFQIMLIIGVLLGSFSFSGLNQHKYKVRTIVIDAGHGGKDPGCLGKKIYEKDVALGVALKLGKLLKTENSKLKVIYTRGDDKFVELHDRAGIANKNNADLFISLHCNSGPTDAHGSESYSMGLHVTDENLKVAQRENASILKEDNYMQNYGGFNPNSSEAYILFSLFQNSFLHQSLMIAGGIEKNFAQRKGRKSRGVKQAGFLVLWKTSMPSVLVELGFLTHTEDETFLTNETNQDSIARDLYDAILAYKEDIEDQG